MKKRIALTLCATLAATAPAHAGNTLVPATPQKNIAKSSLSATPDSAWNRLGYRDGKFTEIWTKDGDSLNKLTFFGGVPNSRPLFREVNQRNTPLPKVRSNMLITDIPTIVESSYRIHFSVNRMTIDTQEPALFGGYPGIKFTYTFVTANDEVERQGEAIGAFIKGRLYLVTYEAPAVYFFQKDLSSFRKLAATLKL